MLRRWQVTGDLPVAASIGLDGQGRWSTANGGLAEGFLEAIGQCCSDDTLTVPTAFSQRCISMIQAESGAYIAPDFAGGTG